MPRSHFARLFVAVLFVAALSSPPAWGAPSGLRGEKLLDVVTRAWGALAALWAPAGCGADPHGGCASQQEETPAAPTTDAGCIVDPHGGCAPEQQEIPIAPTTDEGCIADPHGGCRPGS